MGRMMPKIIKPAIVISFTIVIQYSTSPFRRTLKTFRNTGMKERVKSLAHLGNLPSVSQYDIIFIAPTSCTGTPIAYENQYDQPQTKLYALEYSSSSITTAGERHRFESVMNPPVTGSRDTISPRVIYNYHRHSTR